MLAVAGGGAWIVSPFAFLAGLLVGVWIGARYDLRRKRDL